MWKAERSTSTRAAALLPSAVAGPRLLSAHVRFTIHHPGAPPPVPDSVAGACLSRLAFFGAGIFRAPLLSLYARLGGGSC